MKTILPLLGMFFIMGCCPKEVKIKQTQAPKAPSQIAEIGGSNFAFYKVEDEYCERNEPKAWWKPGVLKHAVGAFHMQKPGYVKESLDMMYESGQRKIALVLWFNDIEKNIAAKGSEWGGNIPPGYEHTYGHTIDCVDGELVPRHKENLKALLALIQQAGFESVTIRFAAQGLNNPMEWTQWEEEFYNDNTSFISSTKKIVDSVLKDKIKIYYDLGLELGGLDGLCEEYTARLWKEYTSQFGASDTIGFSFAVEPGRITRMLEIYAKSGNYPFAYPLDIYYDADRVLEYVAKEFRQAGINDPAIIIQETFYNDLQTLREVQLAAVEYDLNILYIVQWQVERARMHWENEDGSTYFRHFSVSRPVEYNNYLRPTD